MHLFDHLRIGPRLMLGFLILILSNLAVAGYGWWQLREASAQAVRLADVDLLVTTQLAKIKDNQNIQARAVRNVVMLTDPAKQKEEHQRLLDMRVSTSDVLKRVTAALQDDEAKALLAALEAVRPAYAQALDKVVSLAMDKQIQAATDLVFADLRKTQAAYFKATDDLAAHHEGLVHARARDVHEQASRAGWLMLAIGALATVAGSALAWLLSRSIVAPLSKAISVAQAVAAGNLGSRIEVRGRDEAADLLTALNTMNQNLQSLVGQVRQSSDSIATGSAQIAGGNADLSQRTEQQAANLQQTVASLADLATTVKHSAATAHTATELASQASAVALKGGQAVGQVVATMDEISASSRRIADIIGTIDGIAFQTNILALNAAVEAARAGEQGRGFAVVAAEVRSLAQRSAGAAREIKGLIGQSVERVEAGARQVGEAGSTMHDIVAQVQRVSQLIAEIGESTLAQTRGIDQVSAAAGQIDQMTQQNAALVEQSAAAAESLKQQAQSLTTLVGSFRLQAG